MKEIDGQPGDDGMERLSPEQGFRLKGSEKLEYVTKLFDRIAERYDLTNLVISLGTTTVMRFRALAFIGDLLPTGARILDVGCGSGWVSQFFHWWYKSKRLSIEGLDCSQKMLDIARLRDPKTTFTHGDVTALPYEAESYDFVVSVYTLRNFPDQKTSFEEMQRVLKPRGTLLLLDSFPPVTWLVRFLLGLWLKLILPILGDFFTGERWVYEYLSASIQGTKSAAQVSSLLQDLGFSDVKVSLYPFGFGRIVASKPAEVQLKPIVS